MKEKPVQGTDVAVKLSKLLLALSIQFRNVTRRICVKYREIGQ